LWLALPVNLKSPVSLSLLTMPYLLGIDQGTTQTTAVIVNERGEMIDKNSSQLPARFPQAGWVEQDPLDILRTVREACAPLLAKYDIAAVGFDNQGETFIVWDKDTGEPVTPAIVWQDTRGESVCKALAPRVDTNGLRQKTGLLLDSYFSAPKLKWVLNRHMRGSLNSAPPRRGSSGLSRMANCM
jgi:glycerol kinase